MLEPHAVFEVPGFAGISVYPDDETAGGFYAFPDRPRVARDSSRSPQIRLLLYGDSREGRFEASGGMFSCTTTLTLESEEEQGLREALNEQLEREQRPESGSAPRAQLLSLVWRQGRAELRPLAGVELVGQPSLYGGNECVFQLDLDGPTAKDLEQAWNHGLQDAFVSYELKTAGGAAVFTETSYRREVFKDSRNRQERSERTSTRVDVRERFGTDGIFVFEGRLELSAEDLTRSVKRVALTRD